MIPTKHPSWQPCIFMRPNICYFDPEIALSWIMQADSELLAHTCLTPVLVTPIATTSVLAVLRKQSIFKHMSTPAKIFFFFCCPHSKDFQTKMVAHNESLQYLSSYYTHFFLQANGLKNCLPNMPVGYENQTAFMSFPTAARSQGITRW